MNISQKLIEDNNIEEIYLKIIISLLEKEKLEDYEYASNIFEQMGLKEINITENIYNELKEIFGSDKKYIKKYLIKNFEDLCDEKNINFYFIIFNYIFKDLFYLNNIPFLFDFKNVLLKIAKNESGKFFDIDIKNSKLKKRLEYNINFICDSNYYKINYLKKNNDLFSSNKNQELIEKIKNEKKVNENKEKDKKDNNSSYEKDIESKDFVLEESIINLKLDEDSTNQNEIIKPQVDESQSVISLESKNNNNNNIENSVIDSSVIIPKSSTFLNKNDAENYINKRKEKEDVSQMFFSEYETKYDNSNLETIEFEKIVGNHGKSADFVKQIDDFFVSAGEDTNISIYDYNYKRQIKQKIKERISNVSVLTSTKTEEMKKDKNLITCTKDNLLTTTFNTDTFIIKSKKYDKFRIPCNFILELRKSNYIVCGSKGVYVYYDLFSKIVDTRNIMILKEAFTGGIVLSDDLFAISSNEIITNGVNKLIIYNTKSKKVQKEIKGYSFIPSCNGLSIMEKKQGTKEETKSYSKTLLCACKKYKTNQKNGILFVNVHTDNKIKINNSFYDTGNFEVYCFCPLMKEDKDARQRIFENNHFLIKTEYFLAGGYDNDRKRGMIKLFKLKYNENNEATNIEYIQEIKPEKRKEFKGFKKPISCMIQTRRDGKILISSWDGNVYLFSTPKFESFLDSEEEQINSNNFFYIKEDKVIVLEA